MVFIYIYIYTHIRTYTHTYPLFICIHTHTLFIGFRSQLPSLRSPVSLCALSHRPPPTMKRSTWEDLYADRLGVSIHHDGNHPSTIWLWLKIRVSIDFYEKYYFYQMAGGFIESFWPNGSIYWSRIVSMDLWIDLYHEYPISIPLISMLVYQRVHDGNHPSTISNHNEPP